MSRSQLDFKSRKSQQQKILRKMYAFDSNSTLLKWIPALYIAHFTHIQSKIHVIVFVAKKIGQILFHLRSWGLHRIKVSDKPVTLCAQVIPVNLHYIRKISSIRGCHCWYLFLGLWKYWIDSYIFIVSQKNILSPHYMHLFIPWND